MKPWLVLQMKTKLLKITDTSIGTILINHVFYTSSIRNRIQLPPGLEFSQAQIHAAAVMLSGLDLAFVDGIYGCVLTPEEIFTPSRVALPPHGMDVSPKPSSSDPMVGRAFCLFGSTHLRRTWPGYGIGEKVTKEDSLLWILVGSWPQEPMFRRTGIFFGVWIKKGPRASPVSLGKWVVHPLIQCGSHMKSLSY